MTTEQSNLPTVDEMSVMMALTMLIERGLLPGRDATWVRGVIAERTANGVLTQATLAQAASLINRHGAIAAEHGIPVPELPGARTPEPRDTGAPRPGATTCEINVAPSGELIVTGTPYEMREILKTMPGHRYSRSEKAWYLTAAPAVAAMMGTIIQQHHLPLAMGPKAKALAIEHTRRRETAQILDPDAPVPELDWRSVVKKEPWEHQLRMAEFLMRSSAAVAAVPMGGGKTQATIMALNLIEAQRALVVCPNPVRGVWGRELFRHSARDWHVVDGRRRAKSRRSRTGWIDLQVDERLRQGEEALFDCSCGRPHMMVINYEIINNEVFDGWAPRARFDALIYDELHRVKSHAAKNARSGAITVSGRAAAWVDLADHRWGLSGTPIATDPAEDVFGTYRALDPGIFGTTWDSNFREADGKPRGHSQRYQIRNPKNQNHVIGYANLADLARKASLIMYRPQVQLDLPPSTTETVEVELDSRTMKAYREMETELVTDLAEFIDPASASAVAAERDRLAARAFDVTDGEVDPDELETETTAKNPMVKLLRLQQLTGGVLCTDDGVEARVWDTGKNGTRPSPKGDALAVVLESVGCHTRNTAMDPETGELVEARPEPVVVFCRFSSDLMQVREIAEARGLAYGEISGRRKDGLSVDSTMAEHVDVLGVQIQAGGTGIELVRARVVVWWSVGYSLVDFDQAVKRVHRPGQTRPVLNIHLVATGTADEAVYTALNERRSTVASFYRLAGFRDEEVESLTAATAGWAANAGTDLAQGDVAERADTLEVPELDDPVSSLHAGAVRADLPFLDQAERLGNGRVYKPRKRTRRGGAPTSKGRGRAGRGAPPEQDRLAL